MVFDFWYFMILIFQKPTVGFQFMRLSSVLVFSEKGP